MIDLERLTEDYEVFYDDKICAIVNHHLEQGSQLLRVNFDMGGRYDTGAHFNSETGLYYGQENDNVNLSWVRRKSSTEAVDKFKLRTGIADWPKDDWVEVESFDTIADAKAAVAEHQRKLKETDSPFRVMIKKEVIMESIGDHDLWAADRFGSGAWTAPTFSSETWIKPELAHHHVHIAVGRSDASVVFARTPQDAQREAYAVCRVGPYLTEFYSDVLTAKEIEQWVHKADPPGEIVLSGKDPEAIYKAYRKTASCANSCMTYEDGHGSSDEDYDNGEHWQSDGLNPVRVYGAGDLEVAILMRNGKPAARALVWPEKKVVGRRYGDTSRMKAALEAQGYVLDCDDANDMHARGSGGFEGARILKRRLDNYDSDYMMPYMDFGYRVHNAGDHFVMTRKKKGWYAQDTNGTMFEGGSMDDVQQSGPCDRCNLDEEGHNHLTKVGGEDWCYKCVETYTKHCNVCRDRHPITEDFIELPRSIHLSSQSGAVSCADRLTNCGHCNNQMLPVYATECQIDGQSGETITVCLDCRQNHAEHRTAPGAWRHTWYFTAPSTTPALVPVPELELNIF